MQGKMNQQQKDQQYSKEDNNWNQTATADRPWVDKNGRAIVRDSSGKIIPNGSGKCALCGRDAVDTGMQIGADGKPLPRNAQGKQVGTDRHGNKFDDNGVLVETKASATKPLVVDDNGNEIKA